MHLTVDQFIQILIALIALVSLGAVYWTADSTKRIAQDTQKARRPYLKLVRIDGPIQYFRDSVNIVVFPYVLVNTGDSAAINIHKDHIVIKLDHQAQETEISESNYKEPNSLRFALIPNDQSIVHLDNIYVQDVNNNVGSFFVEYTIWYQSDIPNDSRQFKSFAKFQLVVQKIKNKRYVFSNQNVLLEKDEKTFEKPIR